MAKQVKGLWPDKQKTPLPCKWGLLNIVVAALHANHFIVACTIPPSVPTPSSALTNIVLGGAGALSRGTLSAEINGSQLSPLTGPYSQRCHESCAACLEGPPEEVGRDGMGVERGNNQVDEVYGECKIKDQLGARDEEEDEDGAGDVSACSAEQRQYRCQTYQVRLFRTQTRPRVQPTAVSPRRLRQLNNRSVLTSLPATRAVKTMRTAAQT